MIRATGSLRLLHGASGAVPMASNESRLVNTILTAIRKEKALDRETFDDDCIVHPRNGDEDMFNDLSDFLAYLKGYVILSVEEYARLGGAKI